MGRELGQGGGVCDILRYDLLFCGGVESRMGVLDVDCAIRNVGDQEVAARSKQSMTGGPRLVCRHLLRFNRWKNSSGSKESRLG